MLVLGKREALVFSTLPLPHACINPSYQFLRSPVLTEYPVAATSLPTPHLIQSSPLPRAHAPLFPLMSSQVPSNPPISFYFLMLIYLFFPAHFL